MERPRPGVSGLLAETETQKQPFVNLTKLTFLPQRRFLPSHRYWFSSSFWSFCLTGAPTQRWELRLESFAKLFSSRLSTKQSGEVCVCVCVCAYTVSFVFADTHPGKRWNVFSYCRFEAGSLNQLHVSRFCCFVIVTLEHLMNGRRTRRSRAPADGSPRKNEQTPLTIN